MDVSFGSKVRPRIFECVAMGSELLCIFRYRLHVCSTGSSVTGCKLLCLDLV